MFPTSTPPLARLSTVNIYKLADPLVTILVLEGLEIREEVEGEPSDYPFVATKRLRA